MRTIVKWVSTLVAAIVVVAVVAFLLYALAKAAWVTPTIINNIASWLVFVTGSILVVGVVITILVYLVVEMKHKLQESSLPLSSLPQQTITPVSGQSTSPRLPNQPQVSTVQGHSGQLIDLSNGRLKSLQAMWDNLVKTGKVVPGLSQEQLVYVFLQACLASSVQVSIREVARITGVPRSSVGVTKSWYAYANKQPLPKV